MPKIIPFRGVTYNRAKVKDFAKVVAPPYDVIPPKMQDALYRASPYNIVRLILGKIKAGDGESDNRYTRARNFFDLWLKSQIITQDPKEAFYIYSESYKTKEGKKVEQIGFIGLMGLDTKGAEKVLPHENTLAAPKLDRLNLMRAVDANLSPIFVLYDDDRHKILNILKKAISSGEPYIDITFGKVRHKVWRVDDEKLVKTISDTMTGKDIFIADGHHRYETARTYFLEMQNEDVPESKKQAAGYLMVYFVESNDDMLTILAAHRLVKDVGSLKNADILERLGKFFRIEKVLGVRSMMSKLAANSARHIFGMYLGKKEFYTLILKDPAVSDGVIKSKPKDWKRLDVSILHQFIFQYVLGIRDDDDNIEFVKDAGEAAGLIDKRHCKIAFFLNPTKVSQVKRIAKLGERMPRKATYFYPKPLSGLVINKH